MIRLDVITAENNSNDVIANPTSNALELADFYRKKMAEASSDQTELLCFEGIVFEEKRSVNFQNINILEKCIMDFLYDNEYPKKVCIVCDTPEQAELYKVVYNFHYPEIEDERLVDAMWD